MQVKINIGDGEYIEPFYLPVAWYILLYKQNIWHVKYGYINVLFFRNTAHTVSWPVKILKPVNDYEPLAHGKIFIAL